MKQEYSSEKTSRAQVPALHKALLKTNIWKAGNKNADIGGGKYELTTLELQKFNITNLIYDPYNRSETHNKEALNSFKSKTDTATIANVLNVIKEKEVRKEIIKLASKTSNKSFFTVYEGDKSGIGKETKCGWQENRKLDSYVKEVSPYFKKVRFEKIGGLLMIFGEN